MLVTDADALCGASRWTLSVCPPFVIVAAAPLIVGAIGVAICHVCVVPGAVATRS